MKQGMKWIRQTYKVPAFRGREVEYTREGHTPKTGKITSACRGDLRIRFQGDVCTYPAFFHPRDLRYL